MFKRFEKLKQTTSFKSCESGVAAIEIAIVIPIFMLLFAGIMNFGYIIYVKHTMQDIAGDTLRSVIYGDVTNKTAERDAKRELRDVYGSFNVVVKENSQTENVTVTIIADSESSTLMPLPFVSANLLSDEFSVSVTASRITQFNPTKI